MAVPAVQMDPVFEGADGENTLIKYNPLTNMTSAEVWNFLRIMNVPTNKLHECGYVSIGCEPCTRPVLPNQQEREGRWWWEDSAAKECGLHSGNISGNGEAETAGENPDLYMSGAPLPLQPALMYQEPNRFVASAVLGEKRCRVGIPAAQGLLCHVIGRTHTPMSNTINLERHC